MIDSTVSSLLPTSSALSSTGTNSAWAPDVARFQAAMASPTEAPDAAPVNATSASSLQVDAPTVPKPASLGDAIIASLQSASVDVQAKWGHVSSMLANKELSITEALNVQMNVLQVSVQYDLISKGITKTVQNLDQTLKTQ
jgi:type III secretion protein I